jgi:endoglucanase
MRHVLFVAVSLAIASCGVPPAQNPTESAASALYPRTVLLANQSGLSRSLVPWRQAADVPAVDSGSADIPSAESDAPATEPDVPAAVDVPRDDGPVVPGLSVRVDGRTSTTVRLAWDPIPGAGAIHVLLGAEPPASASAAMAVESELEVLAGNATEVTLEGLAPAVDHFLRVSADTDAGTLSGTVHARTIGGPRASLDSPVREVHGYAPKILQVVLANGNGAQWQAGPWQVARRDGSPIGVVDVARQSLPVGAPAYSVGYGKDYDDSVIDVDHRIYLILDSAIGSPEILRIQGPGIDMLVPFSDRYLETPVVQLNQVGYNPRASRRYAYVSGWMGDAGPLSLAGFPATADVLSEPVDPLARRNSVRAALPITLRSAADKDAATEVREIDLALVPADEAAVLRIRIPGVGVSWRTAVSEKAAFEAFYVVVRGLFFNRWHGDLNAEVTDYVRPADHGQVYTAEGTDFDAKFSESQPKTGARALVGGYHDAGDFDQRPMHTVVPQLLMRAYETNPGRFTDGQARIPESGNGIPDLLDEALWGVQAWEALQESDGGVRMGVESTRHPWAFYLASDDPLTYWTYSRCAKTSARAAGIFAQAARLVVPFDADRAAILRDRAIRAFAYAKANGATAAFLLYGASELFRLTGEAAYKTDFGNAWKSMGAYGAFNNMSEIQLLFSDYKAGQQAMPDYLQGYYGAVGADAGIRDTTKTWMTNLAKNHVAILDGDHAHRNPRPSSYPATWGQFVGSARFMDTVIGRMALGDMTTAEQQKNFDALSLSADFVLGGNPDGLVYFTGLGSRHPEEPLHLDSLAFVKLGKGTVPGIPVYGPVDNLNAAQYQLPARNAFFPSFDKLPLGRRFADVRTVVQCTEFTVWESQAPFAELFGLLLGPGMKTDVLSADLGPDLVQP